MQKIQSEKKIFEQNSHLKQNPILAAMLNFQLEQILQGGSKNKPEDSEKGDR